MGTVLGWGRLGGYEVFFFNGHEWGRWGGAGDNQVGQGGTPDYQLGMNRPMGGHTGTGGGRTGGDWETIISFGTYKI